MQPTRTEVAHGSVGVAPLATWAWRAWARLQAAFGRSEGGERSSRRRASTRGGRRETSGPPRRADPHTPWRAATEAGVAAATRGDATPAEAATMSRWFSWFPWPHRRRANGDAVKRQEQEALLRKAQQMTRVYEKLAPSIAALPESELSARVRNAITLRHVE